MNLFLNCYIWGEGYYTKCFNTETHVMTEGSNTMDEQERNLFIRSNAKLLLADVQQQRFGFVRKIDSGKKDENGRKCMINIAFEGDKTEVDPLLYWASDDFCGFSEMVCRLVFYEENEFNVDWSIFQEIIKVSSKYINKINTLKRVALVCAEPSLDYFLKHCGMSWQKKDIECQISTEALSAANNNSLSSEKSVNNNETLSSEKNDDINVFFYCPTPSMGWILRQIDAADGSVEGQSTLAKNQMSSISSKFLDNHGCKMGLFQSNESQCFIVKDVKADKIDRYGQLKTVSFVAESIGNSLLIKQLAAFALLDYENFSKMLLDCVTISASTEGYRINSEKLRNLIGLFGETKQPVKSDSRILEWNQIIQEKKKKYTYLILLSTLDYLNNATGLCISKSEIAHMYPKNKIEEKSEPLFLDKVDKVIYEDEYSDSKKEINNDDNKDNNNDDNNDEITICSKEISVDDEKVNVSKEEISADDDDDFIDLLDYPAFKISAGILVLALFVTVVFIIYHYMGK